MGSVVFHIQLEEVYLIRRKDLIDPRFFLASWEHEKFSFALTRWTPHQSNAKEFITEEAVETFKAQFLKHHPCEIIRIKN